MTVTQCGEEYLISFKYDPTLIELVKEVPGRRWDPNRKVWIIPALKLGWLINALKGTEYEASCKIISNEHLNENATLDATPSAEIPNTDLSDVHYYVKKGAKPYQHQLDFMKYAIDRQQKGNIRGFICGDQPGLGKTNTSMNLAIYNREHYHFKHCLVICCINSSKYNWLNDIVEHTRGKFVPYIIGSRIRKNGSIRYNGSGAEKLVDLEKMQVYGGTTNEQIPYFMILNIEALRTKIGKRYVITERLIELINTQQIDMIIIDEVHKNVSPTSTQGKMLLKLQSDAKRIIEYIPMTGTPITNKPTDLYLPLKLIGAHAFKNYYTWCQYFCVYGGYGNHEIVGYKNIPLLKDMLQKNMLRRLKKDVLDLPPKIEHIEYVENTTLQEKLYHQVAEGIISEKSQILNLVNPLAKFMRLRQVNGSPEIIDDTIQLDASYIKVNAKLKRIMELLEDIIEEQQEKVVIFSNWVEPLRTLYRFVSQKYKVCCFTGTMKEQDREQHKRVFQTNPEYKVLLGTIGAAGITHTFTAATNVIFFDEPWNATDKEQAEDRCYRVGTHSSVNIYTLLTQDTIDERVHDILYTKEGISKFIVDDQLDMKKNPQLFDLLLGDIKKTN